MYAVYDIQCLICNCSHMTFLKRESIFLTIYTAIVLVIGSPPPPPPPPPSKEITVANQT